MKLIDEKGRLFGKINVFDLAVMLIVVFALAGVYYKFVYMNRIVNQTGSQTKAIVGFFITKETAFNVDDSFTADAVSVGDVIKELRSNTEIGTVIRKEVKPASKAAANSEGKLVLSEIPNQKDIFIYIETTADYDPDMKLGSVNGKVGAKIELKGPKFQVQSVIIGVDSK